MIIFSFTQIFHLRQQRPHRETNTRALLSALRAGQTNWQERLWHHIRRLSPQGHETFGRKSDPQKQGHPMVFVVHRGSGNLVRCGRHTHASMELIYELFWQIPNKIDKSEIVQVLN